MFIDTDFKGHIFQVTESLDYGDAISNQVIALQGMLQNLGFSASIHSMWSHGDVKEFRAEIDAMAPADTDIVIFHYYGYSSHALSHIQKFRCTKVCVYHNITPHGFFEPGTDLYDFCLQGRRQLPDLIRDCHYFWADSDYNLQELLELGANPNNCAVLPIVVEKSQMPGFGEVPRQKGAWMFLGRVAASKGHMQLVKLFADVRKDAPDCARKLYFVGGYNPNDPYYQRLKELIDELRLNDFVTVTGKVPDSELKKYFGRASVYVSMSEHEGFGVPLIEAAHYDLPVVALRNSAIGETLGEHCCLADNEDDMRRLVKSVLRDAELYAQVVEYQKRNALRFSMATVNSRLVGALQAILPDRSRFSTVSVVICTYNRGDLLDRCLDYLQYQNNQNFEVVVVNGPSTDSTDEVLENYKHRIKVACNPERNLSKSRNLGIELADGDLIAFIDDDALPFDDWIDTLLYEFGRRPLTHAAIGGPAYYSGTFRYQAEDIGINKFAEARVNIDSAEIGRGGWERSMLGTNTCFRADVIREADGFDEQFDYFLDESELSFRLQTCNHIVGYAPDLYLRHEFAQSHNREGKYKYNWYTICKNTAYYIAAYSGLEGADLEEYLQQRMESERIRTLKGGVDNGELSLEEYQGYVEDILSGVRQGLADAQGFPRTRMLNAPPGEFRVYTRKAAYPLVGCDLEALHICLVTKEFPPFTLHGGIGTLYYHLASELLLMGHYVTIIAEGESERVFRQGRFAIRFVQDRKICQDSIDAPGCIRNINWSVNVLREVAATHAEQPIDIVDSVLWDTEALAIALIPPSQRPPLVVRLITPFSVTARLNGWGFPEHQDSLYRAAEIKLIEQAQAIIPISKSIANTIEAEHGILRDARWAQSYCGIAYWPSFDVSTGYSDLAEVNGQPLGVPNDAKIILFLGRLEGRKGVDVLFAAASEFLASDPKAHLLLVGLDYEGWQQKAENILAAEVTDRVHYLGKVDDATRDKLLHIAYCVVFPSRYESFGLVILESFAHGIPVIASKSGAIPELVIHEQCGLLFAEGEGKSLARCASRLLADADLRKRLSDGAKKQIRRYSSRNTAIGSVKVYARLVSESKRRRAISRSAAPAQSKGVCHAFFCDGSDPRLSTQCGTRVDNAMQTTGAEGFLVFGPYVKMPSGRYAARLYGWIRNPGVPNGLVEVAINSGSTTVSSSGLSERREDGVIAEMEFGLDALAELEIRCWVAADADIGIRRLEIFALDMH
jgi:glycosyltransferase involved in cell wall biosynthesis